MTDQYATPVNRMSRLDKSQAERQARTFGQDVVGSPFVQLVKHHHCTWAAEFENGDLAQVVRFPAVSDEYLPEIGVIWGEYGQPSIELITRPSDGEIFEMHPDWNF